MPQKDYPLLNFPQVCIVEASAGSGKTYELSKRFVQLLLNPDLDPRDIPFKNILAITFSNKAAFEMKERILEFLKKVALDRFSSDEERDDILSSIRADRESAKKRAVQLMDYLVKNYNFFQVKTIDSFINVILLSCSFKLGFSANFKTKTDYEDYLSLSLDKLIEKAASDRKIKALLLNFIMQFLHFENKGSWFPKKEILKEVRQLFEINNKYRGELESSSIEFEDISKLKRSLLKDLRRLKETMPEETHSAFQKKVSSMLEDESDSFDIRDLSDYFAREFLPVKKEAKIVSSVEKLWKKITRDVRRLAESESAFAYNCYIEIFRRVFEDFKEETKKDDVLFVEELNRTASVLFREGYVSVPELYYRLATRLKHFLLDEFQDTSLLQWRNIFPMIEEALSCGGSLFYVGDKKQAIYRFRGGEVDLFDSVKAGYRNHNEIYWKLNLNRRSQAKIVGFINSVFSPENLKRFLNVDTGKKQKNSFSGEEIKIILEVFDTAEQLNKDSKDKGFVRIERIASDGISEADEAVRDKVVSLLKDLYERFDSYEGIAILTRKNDDVELLTGWLIESGIPVESEKTLNIKNNPYIKEIISLLKFLNSPIDDLSFVSFITGEIFSKAAGIPQEEMRDFIFSLRDSNFREDTYCYRKFRSEFKEEWDEFIEEFFRSVGFVSPYELTVSILSKFSCFLNFSDYQGFFMKLLELIKAKEEEYGSLVLFLEYFQKAPDEELYVNVSETDCVKILTIHKAKGLEFRTVILPFFEMNIKVDAMLVEGNDERLELMRMNNKYRIFSPLLESLYRREYLRAFIDELNNIYVALTRAQEELYLFVQEKVQRSINPASYLIPMEGSLLEIGEPVSEIARKSSGTEEPAFDISASRFKDWVNSLKSEFDDVSRTRNRRRIQRGEFLHKALSLVGNIHNQDKEEVVLNAINKASLTFADMGMKEEATELIRSIINKKEFESVFNTGDSLVFQEKEVLDRLGNIKRIDRLIVRDSQVWVIDYKSSMDEVEEGRQQVRQYMEILSEVYPRKHVRGFLLYLDKNKLEEVYAEGRNL